jgi:phosphohistidine phosphatase
MIVYVIRHAWAEEPDDVRWPGDRMRPLTKPGRKRFAEVVEKLAKRDFAPQLVVTSPLLRCVETAQIVARHASGTPGVVERPDLAPDSDLTTLLGWMKREANEYEQVAWVGHAPDVGRIVAALVGDGSAAIDFSKGAVAAVEFDDRPGSGLGVLRWLATAKLLGC